jgi:hypothetical protein
LISCNAKSNRFFMHATLIPGRLERERFMLDFVMLAIGLGFFALSVGYAYATDRP